jgi:hypothetical protein
MLANSASGKFLALTTRSFSTGNRSMSQPKSASPIAYAAWKTVVM